MTLRLRLLLLFLGFAMLPVLLLGAGDYVQSMDALETVIDWRGGGLAGQTAREIDNAYARIRSELRTAAERLALSDRMLAASSAEQQLRGLTDRFRQIRVVEDGELLWSTTEPRTGSTECAGSSAPIPVRVEVPGHQGAELEAILDADAFLAGIGGLGATLGRSGYAEVVDLRSGRVLFDSSCRSVGGVASETVLKAARSLEDSPRTPYISVRYEGPDGDWRAAVAFAAGPSLGVVLHASQAEFAAPFRRSRIRYLITALVILGLAGLGFLFLAQVEFRSLRALTAAAEQIEVGNLRPWLPPPGDDEVGRLSLAFRKMIDRLSESIRQVELNQKLAAVGELASYLSHEIRNPLSSIRLSLQTLHRDLHAGFIPHDADDVIGIALNEVKRLDGVVRTILEVGRQPLETSRRTCSVHSTLEETFDVIGPKVRAHGVELEFVPRADRDQVRADPEQLRGVWINLLVNALDALEHVPGARIRVSTWAGSRPGDELHVRIADNGSGVPAGIVHSIFEPFFTTKPRGNGIGLPTALRAIQSWGGTISYEPVAAGSGAVFVVTLKLNDPPEGEIVPEPAPQLQTAHPG